MGKEAQTAKPACVELPGQLRRNSATFIYVLVFRLSIDRIHAIEALQVELKAEEHAELSDVGVLGFVQVR